MKVLSILKKIALFTLIVGLLPFNYVYADGSTFEQEIYNQYVELKEQGVLADDISFDHWLAFKKQEAELIEEFENSIKFILVTLLKPHIKCSLVM